MAGPRRRRIAWVTPFPPARSGIADYSAELLEHIHKRFDVEVVLDPHQSPVTPDLAARYTFRTAREALAQHAAEPYDLFVFHMGNSPYHLYMLPMLWRCHGLIVLHDFCLGNLIAASMFFGLLPKSAAEELEYEGEAELAAQAHAGKLGIGAAAEIHPFNRRVLRAADGILVHSEWSAKRVRERVGVPVATVPLAVQPPRLLTQAHERKRLGLPADDFLICTLGQVGPYKRVASLLHATARLPFAARLLVVGEPSGTHGEELRALSCSLGLEARVAFLGRVPLDSLAAYARACDVCVQLRHPTRGENSAVVNRALFAGAACIVSNDGPISELPHSVACTVRSPDFEVEDLVRALSRLRAEPNARRALGTAAARYAEEHFHPARVAERYADFIEQMSARRVVRGALWVEQVCDRLEQRPESVDELLKMLRHAEAVTPPASARPENSRLVA